MAKRYSGRYRIKTSRLQGWNYGWNGKYSVTLTLKDRRYHSFGRIKDGKMILSPIGKMAHQYWEDIPKHFPNTYLDEFVIMPDHVHGIIIINRPKGTAEYLISKRSKAIHHKLSEQKWVPDLRLILHMSRISPHAGSLSAIVRSYKSAVSKDARAFDPNFQWQPRFYDRIIRDPHELIRWRIYIRNNPKNWGKKKK